MRTQVSTYSGHRLHERPLRFLWEGQWLEVQEILEQGYGPDSLFFKVTAGDGRAYWLQYQEGSDSWEIKVCSPRSQNPV
jgi:hypothetical protein